MSAWLRLLRPHQWAKNLLVFTALLTAHRWADAASLAAALRAFAVFCLAASAIYVLNDALDVRADRAHPDKRTRPFASGALDPRLAWALVPALLAGAALLAWPLPDAARLALLVYVALALAYCLWLKRVLWLDVIALATLYVLRVLAGAFAIAVPPSAWLSAFALFVFASLAACKRYDELAAGGDLVGRAWRAADAPVVLALGAAAGLVAVLVLALYVQSADVRVLYARPAWIWLACPILLYWLGRVWTLAGRGALRGDPILYALRDPASLLTAVALAGVFVVAL
ncbi:MAG TPA: UbiA family prenyltransferase [Pseudomonadota bacterium]|nr:UbiA family prenyltransferase [Pseudomonadota bacterium]HQY35990.1 UbiA family prenyltransferase [Pseudomonadota bacterium]